MYHCYRISADGNRCKIIGSDAIPNEQTDQEYLTVAMRRQAHSCPAATKIEQMRSSQTMSSELETMHCIATDLDSMLTCQGQCNSSFKSLAC